MRKARTPVVDRLVRDAAHRLQQRTDCAHPDDQWVRLTDDPQDNDDYVCRLCDLVEYEHPPAPDALADLDGDFPGDVQQPGDTSTCAGDDDDDGLAF
jgi:hypothetical protein